jgi:uncharacterized protein with beta-barrel porin domain
MGTNVVEGQSTSMIDFSRDSALIKAGVDIQWTPTLGTYFFVVIGFFGSD